MSKPTSDYSLVIVQTYSALKAGKASRVRVRPVAGQGYDTDMDVECARAMRKKHPVGTKFKIWAKLTDREGGKPFLYSYHGWEYEVLDQ